MATTVPLLPDGDPLTEQWTLPVTNAITELQGQHIETKTSIGDGVAFTDIPQTFTHLKIIGASRHDNASGADGHSVLAMTFNGDAGASRYRWLVRWDDPTGPNRVSSDTGTNGAICQIGDTGFQPFECLIPWYTLGGSSQTWKGQSFSSSGSAGGSAGFRLVEAGGIYVPGGSISVINSIELLVFGPDALSGGRISLVGLP